MKINKKKNVVYIKQERAHSTINFYTVATIYSFENINSDTQLYLINYGFSVWGEWVVLDGTSWFNRGGGALFLVTNI